MEPMQSWTRQGIGHMGILPGVGLFEIRSNRVQIRNRLGRSESRPHMSQHHENIALPAVVQDSEPLHLFLLNHRQPEVG